MLKKKKQQQENRNYNNLPIGNHSMYSYSSYFRLNKDKPHGLTLHTHHFDMTALIKVGKVENILARRDINQ